MLSECKYSVEHFHLCFSVCEFVQTDQIFLNHLGLFFLLMEIFPSFVTEIEFVMFCVTLVAECFPVCVCALLLQFVAVLIAADGPTDL